MGKTLSFSLYEEVDILEEALKFDENFLYQIALNASALEKMLSIEGIRYIRYLVTLDIDQINYELDIARNKLHQLERNDVEPLFESLRG